MKKQQTFFLGSACVTLAVACGSSATTPDLETRLRDSADAGASSGDPSMSSSPGGSSSGASSGAAPGSDASSTTMVGQPAPSSFPGAQPAMTTANPNTPASVDGQPIAWTQAPAIDGVQVVAERDSVRVLLPSVSGAVDFRLFALDENLAISATPSGGEHVKTATVSCAGYRQRGVPTTTYELAPQVEFPGVTQTTTFVLEAIDTACPYTGAYGASHGQINAQNLEIAANLRGNYAIYTESEIDATYDALILNGQGWNTSHYGYPAPAVDPKVLGRTTFVVTPLGYAAPAPTKTFFDDFSNEDAPVLFTTGGDDVADANPKYAGLYVSQNSKWSFFGAATSLSFDQGTSFEPVLFDRDRMHLIVSDGGQDDFATFIAYPKQSAQMPDAGGANYLHVTYEVNDPVTDRRYWWLSFCGPDTAGTTMMDSHGFPLNVLNPDSSMQDTGARNFGSLGWNCLALVPRDATCLNGCAELPPDNTTPETDVAVFVYPSGKNSTGANVNPAQYGADTALFDPRWYRQMDAKGRLVGPMLDDVNFAGGTVRFDVYVRKDRIVMYVNGQQRMCNDFPSKPLTMADAMVGFGQVLYHTSDEHVNIGPNGQYCKPIANTPSMRHIYYNEPYLDSRDWDNVGFDENVTLPDSMPSFDPSLCYVSK